MTRNAAIESWVKEMAAVTQPDPELLPAPLAPERRRARRAPDLHLLRTKEDAGPNNNWMAPAEAKAKMNAAVRGCMKGRTLYVVPYCMGPIDSPYSRCGVEITDSAYVVAEHAHHDAHGQRRRSSASSDGDRLRQGPALDRRTRPRPPLHHALPEELTIKSIGSGYGGNALLGKKCHALRIASYQARTEGWLAEHMLIVGLQSPAGRDHYVAARSRRPAARPTSRC
jgi:phosphoenolpyruvate carboxykinase (GTP)